MDHSERPVDDYFSSELEAAIIGYDPSQPVDNDFDFSAWLNEASLCDGAEFDASLTQVPQSFDNQQPSSYNNTTPDDPTATLILNKQPETGARNSVSYVEVPLPLDNQQQPVHDDALTSSSPPTPLTRAEREQKALIEQSKKNVKQRLSQEQATDKEAKPGKVTFKSTSKLSHANDPSHQKATTIPTAVPSLVSSDGPLVSYQPKVYTPVGDPPYLFSDSFPTADLILYGDPQADVHAPWIFDEDLQTQFDWDLLQAAEQVKIQQGKDSYPKQDSVNQFNNPESIEEMLLLAKTENAIERGVRQKKDGTSVMFPRHFGQAVSPAYLQNIGRGVNSEGQWPRLSVSPYQGYTEPMYSANQWLEQPYPSNQVFQQPYPAKQEYRQPAYQANGMYALHAFNVAFPELEAEPEEIKPAKESRRGKTSKAAKATEKFDNAKNKRPAKIAYSNADEHYEPLPQTPRSWGSTNPDTRQPTFKYNARGELTPTLKFTKPILEEYLGHRFDGPLTLWVQICPADSGNRYSHKDISKCRFKDCPIKHNTILKGDYRVTFDEHASKLLHLNPFHNAGYVHLFCLEKQFDFPHLCKVFNVRADTRVFPAEATNKMAITRDYPEMAQVVHDFIANSQTWGGQKWDYSKTLCYALTLESMKHEPATRQAVREKRDGNSVDKHFNNLDIKAENMIRLRTEEPLIVFQRPTIERPVRVRKNGKRKSSHDKDSSEIGSPRKKCKREIADPRLSATKRRTSRQFSAERKWSDEAYVYKPSWSDVYVQKPVKPRPKKRNYSSEIDSEDSIFGSPKKKFKVMKSEPAPKPSSSARKIRKQPARKASSISSAAMSSAYDSSASSSDGSEKRGAEQDERESSVEGFRNIANSQSQRYSLHKGTRRVRQQV